MNVVRNLLEKTVNAVCWIVAAVACSFIVRVIVEGFTLGGFPRLYSFLTLVSLIVLLVISAMHIALLRERDGILKRLKEYDRAKAVARLQETIARVENSQS